MTKNEKAAAPQVQKVTPTLEAPQAEAPALEKPQVESKPEKGKPEAEAAPEKDYRTELVKKAQADTLWKEAEAACKPTQESLALAAAAKEKKIEAEKALKAAEDAAKYGLVSEAVVKEKQAAAEAARAAYTEAAKAAKGFSLGTGGGGLRFKGQMSGLDAALRILAESEKPLNAGAITKAAIEQGLWAPEGQTPASTMSALLQAEIKKGEKARCIKVAAGLYTLRKVAAE